MHGGRDDLPANLVETGRAGVGKASAEKIYATCSRAENDERSRERGNVCSCRYLYKVSASAVSFVGIHTGAMSKRNSASAELYNVALIASGIARTLRIRRSLTAGWLSVIRHAVSLHVVQKKKRGERKKGVVYIYLYIHIHARSTEQQVLRALFVAEPRLRSLLTYS